MAEARTGPWSSLRVRITAIAVIAILIVLAFAGFLTSRWVESTLVSSVDSDLRKSATEIGELLRTGSDALGQGQRPPRRDGPQRGERPAGPDLEDLLAVQRTRSLQLVNDKGTVIEASQGMSWDTPVVDHPTSPKTLDPREHGSDIKGRLRVHAVRVEGDYLLIIAESLRQVDNSAENLASVAVPAGVVVTILLGSLIWFVTGRALKPVDALRAEVNAISEAGDEARVSVPTTAELGRLASTMNGMLDRVAASSEQQRRFVADASHELRSPLAGIRNQLEVNQQHPDKADFVSTEAEMLVECERMTVLIEDLLTLARGDAAPSATRREPVDLDDIIFDQARSSRRDTDVRIDTERVSGAQVFANPNDVRRVLRNLVDNAIRHAAHTVVITAHESGAAVEMTVADDGPGVPAQHAATIFDRFARLDDARARDAGGSGLGLAITKELLERNGGTVELATRAPEGAKFVVRFEAHAHGRTEF